MWDYEADDEPLPETGALSILLDGSGHPPGARRDHRRPGGALRRGRRGACPARGRGRPVPGALAGGAPAVLHRRGDPRARLRPGDAGGRSSGSASSTRRIGPADGWPSGRARDRRPGARRARSSAGSPTSPNGTAAPTCPWPSGALAGTAPDGSTFRAALPFAAVVRRAGRRRRRSSPRSRSPHAWGVLLVRKGGFAVARLAGSETAELQGRPAARAGPHQGRRTEPAALRPAPGQPGPAGLRGGRRPRRPHPRPAPVLALVTGGDQPAVDAVLDDPRLSGSGTGWCGPGSPCRTRAGRCWSRPSPTRTLGERRGHQRLNLPGVAGALRVRMTAMWHPEPGGSGWRRGRAPRPSASGVPATGWSSGSPRPVPGDPDDALGPAARRLVAARRPTSRSAASSRTPRGCARRPPGRGGGRRRRHGVAAAGPRAPADGPVRGPVPGRVRRRRPG